MNESKSSGFSGLIDLASEKYGGKAIDASDEFFAPKENLLKSSKPVFIADKYTENGKWMDGWESRRKRVKGYDWCIIKLGVQGIIMGADIDTDHFLGNHPPYASVDACFVNDSEYNSKDIFEWKEILKRSPLEPGSNNLFTITDCNIFNMIRLNIYPDGGVARFRVFGIPKPDFSKITESGLIDLAAIVNGGKVLVCNDMYFGSKDNLISPGRSRVMGDGWETKRKRIPGYDWTILKLASPGKIKKIIVDTNLFKGNFPDKCSIEGCFNTEISDNEITDPTIEWKELIPKSSLKGHFENLFENELADIGSITHVKLNIYPDGGVSRLRLFGMPD